MTLIYGKPKYKKQKSRHVSNPRMTEYTPCELCGGIAVETHELRSGNGYRRICQELGFQLKLCKKCHDDWHLRMTKHEKNHIREKQQKVVMTRLGITAKQFKERLGKNYV